MQVIKSLPNTTGADLSSKEGYAVEFDTDGVNVCNAITDQAKGVISKGNASGESDIVIFGECMVRLGGTATRGRYGIPHTDGTWKDTASSSQEALLFLESGVAGDLVQAFFYGSVKAQA